MKRLEDTFVSISRQKEIVVTTPTKLQTKLFRFGEYTGVKITPERNYPNLVTDLKAKFTELSNEVLAEAKLKNEVVEVPCGVIEKLVGSEGIVVEGEKSDNDYSQRIFEIQARLRSYGDTITISDLCTATGLTYQAACTLCRKIVGGKSQRGVKRDIKVDEAVAYLDNCVINRIGKIRRRKGLEIKAKEEIPAVADLPYGLSKGEKHEFYGTAYSTETNHQQLMQAYHRLAILQTRGKETLNTKDIGYIFGIKHGPTAARFVKETFKDLKKVGKSYSVPSEEAEGVLNSLKRVGRRQFNCIG